MTSREPYPRFAIITKTAVRHESNKQVLLVINI